MSEYNINPSSDITIENKQHIQLYANAEKKDSVNLKTNNTAFITNSDDFKVHGNISAMISVVSDPTILFKGNDKLVSIELTNVVDVPSAFLSGCSNLSSIEFNEKYIKNIGKNACRDCINLVESDFSSCEELSSISENAFENCSSLNIVDCTYCVSLKNIEKCAFNNDNKIKKVRLFNCINLNDIGPSAFSNCSSLSSVDFTNCMDLYDIEDSAFRNCNLHNVKFHESCNLSAIYDNAFNGNSNLTSVILPPNIIYMIPSGDNKSGSLAGVSACYISAYQGCMGWDNDNEINNPETGVAKYGAITGENLSAHVIEKMLYEITITTYEYTLKSLDQSYFINYFDAKTLRKAVNITGRPVIFVYAKINCNKSHDGRLGTKDNLEQNFCTADFENFLKKYQLLAFFGDTTVSSAKEKLRGSVESSFWLNDNTTIEIETYWNTPYFALATMKKNTDNNRSISDAEIDKLFAGHRCWTLNEYKSYYKGEYQTYTFDVNYIKSWIEYELTYNKKYLAYQKEYVRENSNINAIVTTGLNPNLFNWYTYNSTTDETTDEMYSFTTVLNYSKNRPVLLCVYKQNNSECENIYTNVLSSIRFISFLQSKEILGLRVVDDNKFTSWTNTINNSGDFKESLLFSSSETINYSSICFALVKMNSNINYDNMTTYINSNNIFILSGIKKIFGVTGTSATSKYTYDNLTAWLNNVTNTSTFKNEFNNQQ